MRNTRVTAIALAAFMLILPLSMVVSASEDEGAPILITVPDGTMDCAVFFADNMVYTPQWRIGNFVRIEMMIIDMTGYSAPEDICASDIELIDEYYIVDELTGDVTYDGSAQQTALMTDSVNVLPKTKMVSVSYIEATVTSPELEVPIVFHAEWDPVSWELVDSYGMGREVNKAGHLIYGMLWDTTDLYAGVYTVSVRLGEYYNVEYAIAHFYIGEDLLNDPDHPFVDLVSDKTDPAYADYGIGIGNVTDDGAAWIELGDLISQGSGGGNSDEGGGNQGEGGNGNGGDDGLGQNGSCNGRKK